MQNERKTERKNKVMMILTWNWVPPPHPAFQELGPGSPLGPRGPGWKPHPGIFQSQSADAPVGSHITRAHYADSNFFLISYTFNNAVSSYLSLVYAIKAVGWCSWKHNVQWSDDYYILKWSTQITTHSCVTVEVIKLSTLQAGGDKICARRAFIQPALNS